MKLQKRKGAVTLIELLVVITIMVILATGAVNVFTTQLQKARDSTRISDLNALRNALEQFYQDTTNYPTKSSTFGDSSTGIGVYLQSGAPSDPRTTNASENSVFDYLYNVSPDRNTIPLQEYEISTHFENDGNITNRAETDGGDDDYRLEIGLDLDDTQGTHTKPTVVSIANGIPGNIDAFACVTPAGGTATCTANGGDANPLVIK